MVVTTELEDMEMTEMVALALLATQAYRPFGVMTTPLGLVPTGIVETTELEDVEMTETEALP